MAKVTRATRLLEKIKDRTGMSEDGMRWLIEVLDPMHDEKLHVVGYPDREVAPSVVQMIKKSVDIAIPTTFGGGPWGFHVMIDDQAIPSGTQEYTTESGLNYVKMDDTVAPTLNLPIGGLNVVAFEANTLVPTWQLDTTEAVPHVRVAALALDPDYLIGKTRVLSTGVEIVNTTAQLYKGGSILVYEAPDSMAEQSSFIIDYRRTEAMEEDIVKYGPQNIFVEEPQFEDVILEKQPLAPRTVLNEMELIQEPKEEKIRKTIPKKYYIMKKGEKVYLPAATVVYTGVRSYTYKNVPPNNVEDAMLLPGTQQWDAIEGAYIVQTMSDMNNPPSFVDTRGSLYTINEQLSPSSPTANQVRSVFTDPPSGFATSAGRGGGTNICSFKTAKTIPFHRKGMIVTGQTIQSTYKINYHVIVERIVNQQDKDLVVLAQPSPGEDTIATGLYTELVKKMPIGVRFKDNGLGDWFLGIVDGVADFVSGIGKPIMGAVDGYQAVRKGNLPVEHAPQNYGAPRLEAPHKEKKPVQKVLKQNQKSVGAGRVKKSGLVAEGPRLPGGQFRSANSSAQRKIKKAGK